MQGIEMDTYSGVCKYCGSVQPIMAMDQALAVFDGKAEKITFKTENVNISIKDNDGRVKIQRSDTNKTERSA